MFRKRRLTQEVSDSTKPLWPDWNDDESYGVYARITYQKMGYSVPYTKRERKEARRTGLRRFFMHLRDYSIAAVIVALIGFAIYRLILFVL